MESNLLQETIISLILIGLLLLFLNPFNFLMPTFVLMIMVMVLIVAFSIFAIFIWRENSRDEREGFHKIIAGRAAFLAGSAVLVIGIIIQSFQHRLDFWLVLTLAIMVLAKIAGIIYGRINN